MASRLVGAACLSVATGCTLLVSTSGLSGEAPAPSGDGGMADVTTDPVDASTSDAKSDGEAGAGGLDCTGTGVVVCDDFERSAPEGPAWDSAETSSDGKVEIASDATRKSRVLRATLSGASASGRAALERATGKTATSRVRYAFRLNATGNVAEASGAQVNRIGIEKGSDFWNVYVYVSQQGIALAEQSFPNGNGGAGTFDQTPIPGLEQGGGWRSVEIVIAFGAPAQLSVSIDGAIVLTKGSATAIPAGGSVRAIAGIHYAGENHPKAEVLVDDCVLTVQ
ncbi:MAG: hypothetical protein JST00_24045 [Deltaproteobacteria bacterium]|nr:hypothetical protein [Deltaproteobacteria bacterium]